VLALLYKNRHCKLAVAVKAFWLCQCKGEKALIEGLDITAQVMNQEK